MTDPLRALRKQAKTLQKIYEFGDRAAIERINIVKLRSSGPLKRADFLHVVARENSFASWPQMKLAVETCGLDRATKRQRLMIAISHGQVQVQVVQQLIRNTPDLADDMFGLQVALYDLPAVQRALETEPMLATQAIEGRRPILHLAFSPMLRAWPQKEADMLAIAKLLLAYGADVNDGYASESGSTHMLCALYGAIGRAGNMPLGQWLLDNGADPNDGESLYHATELGHNEGLKMLLAAGADPAGTNALLRAMDADDAGMVAMLLQAGADPNEDNGGMTALHHAALRMSSKRICQLLIQAGADQRIIRNGVSAYSCARVFGNAPLAAMLEPTVLSEVAQLLAKAADGEVSDGVFVDPVQVPDAYTNILREILHLPGRVPLACLSLLHLTVRT